MTIENEIRKIVQVEVRKALAGLGSDPSGEKIHAQVAREVARQVRSAVVNPSFAPYEPTWTSKQAAEFLGISVRTLNNQMSSGQFPRPRKQGRLNAFIPSEVADIRRQRLGLSEVTLLPETFH